MKSRNEERLTPKAADTKAPGCTGVGAACDRHHRGPTDESAPSRLVRLWRQCAEDPCPNSWDALLETIGPWLRHSTHVRMSRLPDKSPHWSGEDVVQDVFLRLLQADRRVLRHAQFRFDQQIRSYLDAMVGSRIRDLVRRRRASVACSSIDGSDFVTCNVVCERPSPYRYAASREGLRHVRRDLPKILGCRAESRRTRRILRRLWLQQWSAAEVARREGMSPQALYALHHRCRRDLRGCAARRQGRRVSVGRIRAGLRSAATTGVSVGRRSTGRSRPRDCRPRTHRPRGAFGSS